MNVNDKNSYLELSHKTVRRICHRHQNGKHFAVNFNEFKVKNQFDLMYLKKRSKQFFPLKRYVFSPCHIVFFSNNLFCSTWTRHAFCDGIIGVEIISN